MIEIRLWHYQLIPVLPDKMLVAEWRECIAIKRQWKKGTLKHRLVSYIVAYDRKYFYNYVVKVCQEMLKRNIKYQNKYIMEMLEFCECVPNELYPMEELNYPEHNDRYLKQCLFNLQEKADRDIISKEDWQKIYDKFKDFTDLYKGE